MAEIFFLLKDMHTSLPGRMKSELVFSFKLYAPRPNFISFHNLTRILKGLYPTAMFSRTINMQGSTLELGPNMLKRARL